MKSKRYTEKELKEAVATNYSIAGTLRSLGLCPTGGNYSIKKIIKDCGLDTSHFTGQANLKGKTHNRNPTRPLSAILVYGKHENSKLGKRLIKEGVKPQHCECCGLTEWQSKPLSLELHHIDGDRLNNTLENLRMLCPNCHSQTENFRSKNKNR